MPKFTQCSSSDVKTCLLSLSYMKLKAYLLDLGCLPQKNTRNLNNSPLAFLDMFNGINQLIKKQQQKKSPIINIVISFSLLPCITVSGLDMFPLL